MIEYLKENYIYKIIESFFVFNKSKKDNRHLSFLLLFWFFFIFLTAITEALFVNGLFKLNLNSQNIENFSYLKGKLLLLGILIVGSTISKTLVNFLTSLIIRKQSVQISKGIISDIILKTNEERDRVTHQVEVSGITNELNALIMQAYLPILNIFSSSFSALFILIIMIKKSLIGTILAAGSTGIAYLILLAVGRVFAKLNAKKIHSYEQNIVNRVLTFLKSSNSIAIRNQNGYYQELLNKDVINSKKLILINNLIAISPRAIIETIGLLAIGSILFYYNSGFRVLNVIIGISIGAQKIIPNLQFIFSNLITLLGNKSSALNALNKAIIGNQRIDKRSGNRRNESLSLKNKSEITLSCMNLSYKYFNVNNLITYPDINIKKGSKVIVLGKSGSGKTTLIELLLALRKPITGEILFKGIRITPENNNLSYYWKKVGYIEQSPIVPNEDIKTFLDPINKKRNQEVEELISKLNLKDSIKEKGGLNKAKLGEDGKFWSKGQLQRLCIGREIVLEKEIIFMDEPTSGLDNASKEIIKKIIIDSNKTFFINTHDKSLLDLADKVIKL